MLRGQAANIGTFAATIPGVSVNGLNNTIRNLNLASGELRRVGFQYARQFNARFKRIQFEDDLSAASDNIKKSNRLFEADRYMRRNPGRYETATQRISSVDRLRELTRPFASKMERYREIYGGDANLIQRAEADEAYREHIKSVRDPIGSRRDALKEKFGGGARGNVLAINAMRAEADEAYRKDMLSDFDSRMEDLTERYGGDRNKAENKYKAELSKQLPLFFRNSKMTSKQMYAMTSTLKGFRTGLQIVGAGVTAIKSINAFANQFTQPADDANARALNLDNLKNLYGGISQNRLNAALRAGMTPEEALKAQGDIVMRYGSIENLYSTVRQFKDASPIERMNMAKELGLNEKTLAWLDQLSGTGRLGRETEREYFARLKLSELGWMQGRRSGASKLSKLAYWLGDKLGITPSLDARSDEIDAGVKVEGAKEEANRSSGRATQPTLSTDGQTASVSRSYSFSIGNVNVDADNPVEFISALQGVANDRSGHSLALAFDTGVIA